MLKALASTTSAPEKRHLLTIAVEDYFQVVAFRKLIDSSLWYRFEQRVDRNTRKALDLLDEFGVKATFFTLGWVADEMPEVLREIAARGHEVASKGYFHRTIQEMTPSEFREDLQRAREAIERATGIRVVGHRIARGHLGSSDLWALDVLAEEGYAYDSSFYPRLGSIAAEPWRRFAFAHRHAGGQITEFPLATYSLGGWMFPIAGGAYLRHVPHALISRAIDHWHRHYDSPLVLYFHVWELDADLPRITAAPINARIRQYRNLQQMPSLLRYYLSRYAFEPVRARMGIAPQPAMPCARAARGVAPASAADRMRTPVTLVIPCFNEESVLPYLRNTLARVASELGADYELRYVFVDDCSADRTWQVLEQTFATLPNCKRLRHKTNRGVAAAILTGIQHADSEIVCSIDCDCTYDPHQLRELIPRLEDNVAVVTASPYHPSGRVLNVPSWRLLLSRTLSVLYRRVFHHQLHTYTSCFRVYRRSQVQDVALRERGFLGVAEFLMVLDLEGKRIVEHPAVLEVRLLGRSKMKVLRTIGGHLRLLWRMAWARRGIAKQNPSVNY
jgi:polysaccharide deacetylase family protein (PEP-CTERM system associated)